jgi:hypothetical protein
MSSGLILPRQYAQMAKPVVFWFSKKLDHIMLPASAIAPPPSGYERIECRHAHEVDTWSNRLRGQEKRFFEMTDLERFEYEGKIQSFIIEEMELCLAQSNDSKNKQFMQWFIQRAKEQRASRRPPKAPESHMACEAETDVAS